MATDLKQQPKPAAAVKHEQFVEQQLDRARKRIRNLDAVTSLLILLVGTLVYGLVMAILDRAFTLPAPLRVAAFVAAAAAAVGYLALIVFGFLQWQINPYYAARRLEETLPDAKNSLINWLDLRDETMPPVIRGTLGRKAAKDLTGANLENAVSARHPLLLAGILAGLFLVLFVWFLMVPGQLTSLLQRAYAPFEKGDIATSTTLTVLTPEGGNAVVTGRQDVRIVVEAGGRVPRVNRPDSLRLHYRYREGDPHIVRPLDEDADGRWVKTVVADEVRTGFFYKVTGGDAATPEYEVKVVALPQVTRFDVTYHYRPYLKQPDREVRYGPAEEQPRPDLKALRGTEVTLVARTNRPWKSGQLVLKEGAALTKLPGEAVAGDAQARRFKFKLDRPGKFHVEFTSSTDEPNVDRGEYRLEVFEDASPAVVLTKPGKDVELPANGTLALEGWAVDDFGVKSMTLKLRVKEPQRVELEAKPYRPGISFKLVNGKYPQELLYKDFVALEKLKNAKGKAVLLAAGTVVEYWVEAVDDCDYPEATGNVGRSKVYKVTIVAPDKNEKQQQQQRQQAEKEQRQHEQKQDKDKQKLDKKAEDDDTAAKQNPIERARQEKERLDELEKKTKDLQDALDKQRQEEERKGKVKSDPSTESKGDKKDKGPDQGAAGEKKDDKEKPGPGEASQKKDGAGKNKAGQEGAGKGPGDKQKQNAQGDGKDKGKPDAKAGAEGQAKDAKGTKQDSAKSEAKGAGEKQPKGQPGEQAGTGKDGGEKKDQKADAGKSKDDGKGGAGGKDTKAGPKGAGQDKQKTEVAKGKDDGKGAAGGQPQQANTDPKGGPKSDIAKSKEAGKDGDKTGAAQAKGEGQPQAGKQEHAQGDVKGQPQTGPRGEGKQGGNQTKGGDPTAKAKGAEGKGGGQAQDKRAKADQAAQAGAGKADRNPDADRAGEKQRPEDATLEDVAKLKEQLQRGEQKEEAIDELSRVRKEARDPKVRKAVEDALNEAGVKPRLETGEAKGDGGAPKDDKTVKGEKKGQSAKDSDKHADTGKGKQGDAQGKEAGKGKGDGGKGKQIAKGQPKKGNPGQINNDTQGQGNGGFEDTPGGPADVLAAKRAGDLQLEELKKKLTPEVRQRLQKEHNWTDADFERFLEQARAYHDRLRQQEKLAGPEKLDTPRSRQKGSWLPSVGTQQVGPRTNQTRDPLEIGQSLPPPEFRDAQKRFTSRPRE